MAKGIVEINVTHAKECLSYNRETGDFYWKERPLSHFANKRAFGIFNSHYAGKKAGTLRGDGYVVIQISGRLITAHRLAWCFVHNTQPKLIDHKNRIKSDNRIDNLREATVTQNNWNVGKRSNNKSGVKGVCWKKRGSKWAAVITVNKKKVHLGLFESLDEAAKARKDAENKFYKKYSVYSKEVNGEAELHC